MVERWSPKPNVEGSSPSAPVESSIGSVDFIGFFILHQDIIEDGKEFLRDEEKNCMERYNSVVFVYGRMWNYKAARAFKSGIRGYISSK